MQRTVMPEISDSDFKIKFDRNSHNRDKASQMLSNPSPCRNTTQATSFSNKQTRLMMRLLHSDFTWPKGGQKDGTGSD